MPDSTDENRPSQTSGRVDRGEAPTLPDACADKAGSWGGIDRHRRAGQPRCTACRKFASDYSREWYRTALPIAAFRERHNEATMSSHRRLRADPDYRAADNAKRRARRRRRQQRDAYDRRHLVDVVAVERAVDGEPVQLNPNERRAAYVQLRRHGYTPGAAGDVLRMNGRTVKRYETEMTEQEAAA